MKKKENTRVIKGVITIMEQTVLDSTPEQLAKYLDFEIKALAHDLIQEMARVKAAKGIE